MQRVAIIAFVIIAIVLAIIGKNFMGSANVKVEFPEPPEYEPAKAIVEETEYDFGTLHQGDQGEHTFEIKSAGPGVLMLEKGKPTCKCTKFTVEPLQVPPGETAVVHVEWTTDNPSGDFGVEAPVIVLNDPERSEIRFDITGSILPLLDWYPRDRLDFGGVVLGDSVTRDVTFLDENKLGFHITKVSIDSEDFSSTIEETHEMIDKPADEAEADTEAGEGKAKGNEEEEEEEHEPEMVKVKTRAVKVHVTLAPKKLPIGALRTGMTIETDVENENFVKIGLEIRATVSGPLEIQPKRVVFPLVRAGKTKTIRVSVYSSKAGRPKPSVTFSDEKLSFLQIATTTDPKDSDRVFIDVTIPPQAKPGKYKGDLHVHTGIPAYPLVILPFQAVIVGR